MRFVSLFAGVGGFDLGFEQAGMKCVGQVEIDNHCQSVLSRHWPDVARHDDVRTAREWASEHGLVGSVDLVCGGFPCQDVSVAGKRAGLAGARTGLFWDALAFATHVEAGWVVLENVPGLLSSNQGRDFGVVISALADAGYRHVEWRVLDSQFHGVAQRRRRVFVVASAGAIDGRAVLVEPEGVRGDPAPLGAAGKEVAATLGGGAGGRGWAPDTDRMTFVPVPADSLASGIDLRNGTITASVTHAVQAHHRSYSANTIPHVFEPGPSLSLSRRLAQREDDRHLLEVGEGDERSGGGRASQPRGGAVTWCAPKLGTLATTFGSKNYSNVQEVSQGSLVVTGE